MGTDINMNIEPSEASATRDVVAMLEALRRKNPARAQEIANLITDHQAFISANLALSLRLLEVIDTLDGMIDHGDYRADALLGQLRTELAMHA